jgi:pimeloyl-ACP methyl ester carboxylesterase
MFRPTQHPRDLRRTVLAAVVAGLLASLLAAPTAAAAPPGSAGPPVPRLRWAPCGNGLECTAARVPLDYDRPSRTTITLALIRLPASSPARRIGSIFVNPGGPGESGVDAVRQGGRSLFSAEVRARFDLVGFDPRGIGASTPLRCFDTLDQALAVLPPFRFPVTAAEERVWVDADQTFARACAGRGGPILDHMATADVARDLDLLRQAVGDRQLTYVGLSYGAYLGATYANLFPAKVRALVLDGVPDPVAWATGRGDQAATQPLFNRVAAAEGGEATLGEFFRLCDQGGPACAFSKGDPRRRYQALACRLLANPVQTSDGPVGYADLVYATQRALMDPALWPGLANSSVAATRVETPQPTYPNLLEGLPGVACSDSDNPDQVGAWRRAADAADRTAPLRALLDLVLQHLPAMART